MSHNDESDQASRWSGILSITKPHKECDLVLVCAPGPVSPDGQRVRFYCNRKVLAERCGLIASLHSFESAADACKIMELELNIAEDIVFEILRFVYCQSFHTPTNLRSRFGEFLLAVDYLGVHGGGAVNSVEDVVESKSWEHEECQIDGIFSVPCVQSVIATMDNEELRSCFTLPEGTSEGDKEDCARYVGFNTRARVLATLAEARLRASNGPPPSDPMAVFELKMQRMNMASTARTDEDDEFDISSPSRPFRRLRSI
eukprot:TRINITY_DN17009_c0_g2_i1.p1 TRINITY_DN17009_c0_g2~~TRINITY_DN17009_c0_g2_i1.p1  ORF type:complete len:258 (+),score=44.10 TRINITY_DN17009_c0_g2_i1:45-818(+)